MTPEAQRIAIAKACGWEMAGGTMKGQSVGIRPDEIGSATAFDYQLIPDYTNDLNAMHEAVQSKLNNSIDSMIYAEHLVQIVLGYENQKRNFVLNNWELTRLSLATAAQQAEAFLKTLNLWTP